MREYIFDAAAGILAGILSGLILLYLMIGSGFSVSSPGFVICLTAGFFLPFCLHFRNRTVTSVTMVLISFAVTVVYAYYVGSHSAEIVTQAGFTGNVLRCTCFVHAASLAGLLADCFIRSKERDRINKGH